MNKKSREEARREIRRLSKIPLTGRYDKEGYEEVDYDKQREREKQVESIKKDLNE